MTCNFKTLNLPDFDKVYEICDCGEHIRNKKLTKCLTIRNDGNDLMETNLSTLGQTLKKKFKIHYLVVKTFILEFNDDIHIIIHKDNNTKNNSLSNLEIMVKEYEPEEEITCTFKKILLPKHPNFTKLYEVCQCGKHVKSLKSGKFLTQRTTPKGYKEVRLIDKTIEKNIGVHQMIAYTYIGNDDPSKIPDHGNGIRDDNRLENLSFKTYSENNTRPDGSMSRKPVFKLDIDNNIIHEYESTTEIRRKYKSAEVTNIFKSLNANVMEISACGFYWKYKFEEDKTTIYEPIENEEFKLITNFKYYNKLTQIIEEFQFDSYEISNFGTIINKLGIKIGFHGQGNYKSVQMTDVVTNERKAFCIHNLVAEYFLIKPENYDPKTFEIKFIDKDMNNMRFDNLQWITHKDHHTELKGRKVKAIDKDGKEYNFNCISDAAIFIEDIRKKKGQYPRSIKACFSGYQKTAYGFIWQEI